MGDAAADGRIPRTTLVDTISEQLRMQLVTGVIRPGERIRTAALERDFDVSHIPIREALRRLEAEGLVVTIPQRGAVAANVGLEDLSEIWDLRRLLEGQVARRAAERMGDTDLETIRTALGRLLEATTDFRSAQFRSAHHDFHWALLAPGATGWIRRVYDKLWQGSDRYIQLFFLAATDVDAKAFAKPHEEFAAAAATRDPDLFEELHIRHLTQTEGEVRAAYLALSHVPEVASE